MRVLWLEIFSKEKIQYIQALKFEFFFKFSYKALLLKKMKIV